MVDKIDKAMVMQTMFSFRSGPHVGLEYEKVKKVTPYLFPHILINIHKLRFILHAYILARLDYCLQLDTLLCNWQAYFGSYFVCDSTLSKLSNSKAQVVGVGDNLNVITMKEG